MVLSNSKYITKAAWGDEQSVMMMLLCHVAHTEINPGRNKKMLQTHHKHPLVTVTVPRLPLDLPFNRLD